MTLTEILAGVPLAAPLRPRSPAGSRRPRLRFAPRSARLAVLRLPWRRADGRRFAMTRSRAARSRWSANPPPRRISPRPGSRWNTAAGPSPSPRATSTAGPTSASNSPASPAPTAKPPPRYLIDSVLRAAGHTTAMIGTIEYHLAGRVLPAVNTTPESLDLMRMFAELERAGGTHATMEVSSHALALGTGVRPPVPHRDLHQSHPGPPGFSRHDGRVFRRQAAPVRRRGRAAAALRRAQPRR